MLKIFFILLENHFDPKNALLVIILTLFKIFFDSFFAFFGGQNDFYMYNIKFFEHLKHSLSNVGSSGHHFRA